MLFLSARSFICVLEEQEAGG